MKNSLVIKIGLLDVVGSLGLARIQSIRVVKLLTVDVHLNFGENWMQIVVYMGNGRNCSLFLLLLFLLLLFLFLLLLSVSSSAFESCWCSFFNFFDIVRFVTTTLDKFHFHSQVRLSQINVLVPLSLKFKLQAVFTEWASRIDFMFVGWHNIVNYWVFPSSISGNCHKRLVTKTVWHQKWIMFLELSLRDRLVCLATFAGMRSLYPFFLLPLLVCFLRVCLPTIFATVLSFFLLLTTSAISVASTSKKSALTRFTAVAIFLRKMELEFS